MSEEDMSERLNNLLEFIKSGGKSAGVDVERVDPKTFEKFVLEGVQMFENMLFSDTDFYSSVNAARLEHGDELTPETEKRMRRAGIPVAVTAMLAAVACNLSHMGEVAEFLSSHGQEELVEKLAGVECLLRHTASCALSRCDMEWVANQLYEAGKAGADAAARAKASAAAERVKANPVTGDVAQPTPPVAPSGE